MEVRRKQPYPYQNFLDILDSRSPETKSRYIQDFNYYLRYLRVKNPNYLVTEKLLDDMKEIRKVEDQIIGYINHLKKQGLSSSTINGRLYAILKFYTANRVNLNRKHITQFKPQSKPVRKNDLAYTAEDIQKLLNYTTNERDKVMLLLLTSTGMRIGALCKLTVGNLSKVYPPGYSKYVYKIVVYAGDKEEYYTFTTFECAAAIDSYLEYRKRLGEEFNADSPLFRNQPNFNLPSIKQQRKVKFLDNKSFHTAMGRLVIKSGLRARIKKTSYHNNHLLHTNMLSHACRKFCDTAMLKAGVQYDTKEFILGHRGTRGLDTSYSRVSVEDRLKEYSKAIDLLTISSENRLRRQVAEQQNALLQVQELAKQIEMIKNVIQKDQTQVRNVRSSASFKEKLQKG